MDAFAALLAEATTPPDVGEGTPPFDMGGDSNNENPGNNRNSVNLFCSSVVVPKNICGGVIGTGGTFCCKPAGYCDVKSHATNRHSDLGSEPVLVVMKTSDIAFSTPRVASKMVSQTLQAEWVGLSLPSSDWTLNFKVASNGDDPVTKTSLEVGLDEKSKARTYKTPSKTRVRRSDFDPKKMAYDAGFSPYKQLLSYDDDSTLFDMESVKQSLMEVELGLKHAGGRLEVVSEYIMERVCQGDRVGELLVVKTDEMLASVGQAPKELPRCYAAPTLWGTVLALIESIESKTGPTTTSPDMVVSLGISMRSAITKVDVDAKAALGELQKNSISTFQVMLKKIKDLEVSVSQLKVSGPPTNVVPPTPGNPFSIFGHTTSTPTPPTGSNDVLNRLTKLEAAQDMGEVSFTQVLGLATLDDALAWSTMNMTNRRFGLFMDAFLFLERMAGDSDTDQATMLTAMDRHVKLKIATGSEALALGALRQPVPKMFHSTSGGGYATMGSTNHQSFLSRLPEYKSWSNGAHGIKPYMTKRMAIVRNSIMQDINNSFKAGSVAYQVAMDSLSRSVAWVNLLMTFVDSTYEALHVHSKFSKEQAWQLVTQLVTRVFTDMATVREGVLLGLRTQDEDSTCAEVLWTVFRTHDRMDEFFNSNISDHPSISSEYVKFLASNSGFEQVEKLDAVVTKLTRDLKSANDDCQIAKRKADTASNAVDGLKKRIDILERKSK